MHYACLVIGPDVEGQLARYDENRDVEPYIAACGWCDGKAKYQPCENCNDTGKETTTRNPEGEWDYWRIGGRYRGFLTVVPGAKSAVLHPPSWEWTDDGSLAGEDWTDRADECLRGDLDLDRIKEREYRTFGLVAEGVMQLRKRYDRVSDQMVDFPGDWTAFWDRMVENLDPAMPLTVVDFHS